MTDLERLADTFREDLRRRNEADKARHEAVMQQISEIKTTLAAKSREVG